MVRRAIPFRCLSTPDFRWSLDHAAMDFNSAPPHTPPRSARHARSGMGHAIFAASPTARFWASSSSDPMKVNATPTVDASTRIGVRGCVWQGDPMMVETDNKLSFPVVGTTFYKEDEAHGNLTPDAAAAFPRNTPAGGQDEVGRASQPGFAPNGLKIEPNAVYSNHHALTASSVCMDSGFALPHQSTNILHEVPKNEFSTPAADAHALPQGPRPSAAHVLVGSNALDNDGPSLSQEAQSNQVVPHGNILAVGMDVLVAGRTYPSLTGLYGRVLHYNKATNTYEVEFFVPRSDNGDVERSMAMPRGSGEHVECKPAKDRYRLKNKPLPRPNVTNTDLGNEGFAKEDGGVPQPSLEDTDAEAAASTELTRANAFQSSRKVVWFQSRRRKKTSRLLDALGIDEASNF